MVLHSVRLQISDLLVWRLRTDRNAGGGGGGGCSISGGLRLVVHIIEVRLDDLRQHANRLQTVGVSNSYMHSWMRTFPPASRVFASEA